MMTGTRLDGMKVGNKLLTSTASSLSLRSVDLAAMSSPKRFEWVKMKPGHRNCSEHMSIELGSRWQGVPDDFGVDS